MVSLPIGVWRAATTWKPRRAFVVAAAAALVDVAVAWLVDTMVGLVDDDEVPPWVVAPGTAPCYGDALGSTHPRYYHQHQHHQKKK